MLSSVQSPHPDPRAEAWLSPLNASASPPTSTLLRRGLMMLGGDRASPLDVEGVDGCIGGREGRPVCDEPESLPRKVCAEDGSKGGVRYGGCSPGQAVRCNMRWSERVLC